MQNNARRRCDGQRDLGADGADGGLLRGALGEPDEPAARQYDDSDVREAINHGRRHRRRSAAKAVPGQAVPDSFTHGSSAQRVRWLTIGLRGGNLKSCDTFAVQEP